MDWRTVTHAVFRALFHLLLKYFLIGLVKRLPVGISTVVVHGTTLPRTYWDLRSLGYWDTVLFTSDSLTSGGMSVRTMMEILHSCAPLLIYTVSLGFWEDRTRLSEVVSAIWGDVRSPTVLILLSVIAFLFGKVLYPLYALLTFRALQFTFYSIFSTKCIEYDSFRQDMIKALIGKLPSPEESVAFGYCPLEPGNIRLIKLTPTFDGIRAEKVHKPLNSAPSYEAISYTWGDPTMTHYLNIQGTILPISANVYGILFDRACVWKAVHLWIDYICINQNDVEEKSAQVRMMRDIYRNSQHTTIWLGSAADAQLAHVFMGQLVRKVLLNKVKRIDIRNSRPINDDNPKWAALSLLLRHPYWERVWVVQEVATSTSLHLLYGGIFIRWEVFVMLLREIDSTETGSLLQILDTTEGPCMPPLAGVKQATIMGSIRDAYQQNHDIPLWEMLRLFVQSKATDERDHVFALQGISSAVGEKALVPDYSLDYQEVYVATALYVLRSKQPFSLLPLAGLTSRRVASELPSWVPDWTMFTGLAPLTRMNLKNNFQAATNASADIVTKGRIISIEGVFVDDIKVIGQASGPISRPDVWSGGISLERDSVRVGTAMITLLWEWQVLAIHHSPESYLNGQSRWEAFWRTLICDTSRENRPAEDECGESYRYFVSMLSLTLAIQSPELFQERIFTSSVQDILTFCRLTHKDSAGIFSLMNYPSKIGLRGPTPTDLHSLVSNIKTLNFEESARFTQHMKAIDQEGTERRFGISLAAGSRNFAVTSKGYMAMVPWGTQPGDKLCIFLGSQTPFLLRRAWHDVESKQGRKMYQLVGEAYAHGIMHGQFFEHGGPEREQFWLQ